MDGNLYEFMKLYYDSTHYNVTDTAESGDNEEFKRTVLEMYPRLFPSGSYNVATDALYDYVNDFRQNINTPTILGTGADCHWENIPIDPYRDNGATEDIGRIDKVTFDPRYGTNGNQTLYAASPFGGLFKSIDNGNNWVNYYTDTQLPFLGVSDIVLAENPNPNGEPYLFISTGRNEDYITPVWTPFRGNENYLATSGVYRFNITTNHWDNIDNGLFSLFSEGGNIRRMIGHPTDNNTLIVATTIGVYRTTNALASNPTNVQWTLLTNGDMTGGNNTDVQFRGLAYHPINTNIIYASGRDIYRSIDGGTTWASFTSGTNWDILEVSNTIERINIVTTPLFPNMLFVHLSGESPLTPPSSGAMKEINYFDGTNWNIIAHDYYTSYKNTRNRLGITISHTAGNNIYLWAGDVQLHKYMYNSQNANFSHIAQIDRHTDFLDQIYAPNSNDIFMYASDGGVAISTNNGTTFTPKNNGLQVAKLWGFDDADYDDNIVVVSQQDCGTRMKLNNNNWNSIYGNDGYGSAIVGKSVFLRENWYYYRRNFTPTSIGPLIPEMSSGTQPPLSPWLATNALDYRPIALNGWPTYVKDQLPIHFQAMDDPNDFNAAYMGYTEIHRRNVADADNTYAGGIDFSTGNPIYIGGANYPSLWTTLSDINASNWDVTSRGIMAAAMSESHTYPMYVVTDYSIYGYPDALENFSEGNIPDDTHIPRLFKIYRDALTQQPQTIEITPSVKSIPTIVAPTIPKISYYDNQANPPTMKECVAMITGIAVHPTNPNKVWITITGYEEDKRVFYSDDAGLTWYNADPNGDLVNLNLPANCIVYQKGTNDRLFIGTDGGIYTKEGNGSWQKFGDCFPNVRVAALKINYCSGKLRAATYGRGLWESELPSLGEYSNERVVSTNETWADDIMGLNQNLRIKTGATLTLEGVLNMPVNGLITVEEGAKFIIDGGKITNQCNQMWAGIVVEGDPALSQFPDVNGNYFQGYIECKNGATIEYAHSAIRLWNSITGNAMGGIVKATDSHFLNNGKSLEFMPYQNFDPAQGNIPVRNAAYIRNSTFKIDDNYRRPNFFAHVTAWRVDGIRFEKCHFENAKTQNVGYAQNLGNGIFTIDAGFSVKGKCSSVSAPGTNPPCPFEDIEPSVFKGLFYGIRAVRDNSANTFMVHGCRFEKNIRGIQSDGVEYPMILQNKFLVGGNPYPISGNFTHEGIVINTGFGYQIEENRMEEVPTTGEFRWTVGTRINNTGPNVNEVYNNQYEGFFVGDLSNGNNFNNSPTSSVGLQFLCNQHTDDYADIAVVNTGGLSGIRKQQGDQNSPFDAGNTFSQNGNFAEGDYFNDAQSLTYYYRLGTSNDPIYYSTSTINKVVHLSENQCESNISFGLGESTINTTEITGKKSGFYVSQTAYASLLYNYEQLIDDGNTNVLVQNITQTWSNDAWTLRTQLLARAPYLSEEALKSAILQDVLPQAMVLEICLANPDVLRNDKFIRFLSEEMNNPLPNYMISILLNARLTGSSRTVLEQGMMQAHTEMAAAAYPIIRQMLTDSIVANSDSLMLWIGNLQTISSQYVIADLYFEKGQGANTLQTLTQIPVLYKLNEEELAEHQNYTDLMNFKLAVREDNRNLSQLTEIEKANLIEIRDASEMLSGVLANNTLCFHYNICKDYPAVLPQIGSNRKAFTGINQDIISLASLKVYPNPAQDFVTFDYELMEDVTDAYLEITDISGKILITLPCKETKMQLLWNTQNISAGVYLYACKRGNSTLAVGKIVVQH